MRGENSVLPPVMWLIDTEHFPFQMSPLKASGFDFAAARANMVNRQVIAVGVTDRRLIGMLSGIPRERFVPSSKAPFAYSDADILLAETPRTSVNRYLISAHVLARLVQAARISPGDIVLDVASGTGYSSAVLGGLGNTVVSLESDELLSKHASEALTDLGASNVVVVVGPLEDGWPSAAPFDVILVGGLIETIPAALVNQLGVGGRLVTVMGRGVAASGMLFIKTAGSFSGRPIFDAAVPRLPGFAHDNPSFADGFFRGG